MKKYIQISVSAFIALLTIAGNTVLFAQAPEAQLTAATTATDDTMVPSDVENLQATAGDAMVRLMWKAATDNVGVTGYKIYRGTHSVQTSGDQYDLPVISVGNVTSYEVKNLSNGVTYYFSLTAVDAKGNESVNYAREVNATPAAGLRSSSVEDDGKAPQVKDVRAEDVVSVQVEFSEPVRLPAEFPASAFQIVKEDDQSRLGVQKAEIDTRDASGKTVLLTTSPHVADAQYVLTAGIEVQDLYNNPIVSGTSDTGSFKGSAKQKTSSVTPPPSGGVDTTAPTVTSSVADYNNRIAVAFSEMVVLPQDPSQFFVVMKKGTTQKLNVINVSLSTDGKTIYITTGPQEPVEYELQISGVKDTAGNSVAAQTYSVTGRAAGVQDLIPPEDVTKLLARLKAGNQGIVALRWQASKNSAKDLADQVLYQAEGRNGGAYGQGTRLGANPTSAEIQDLQGGKWYTFKITARDGVGNESRGAITSIYLPETGPGIAAAGLTSLFMGWFARRKKKGQK